MKPVIFVVNLHHLVTKQIGKFGFFWCKFKKIAKPFETTKLKYIFIYLDIFILFYFIFNLKIKTHWVKHSPVIFYEI